MKPPPPPVDPLAGAEEDTATLPAPLKLTGRFPRLRLPGWRPRPVPRPQVDPDLSALPAPQRCAEVLRFSLLRAEHWLSPRGTLREWVRLQLWLALWLAIPAALLVPLVSVWLTAFSGWSVLVAETVRHLLLVPAGVFASALLFALTILLRRVFSPRR